MNKLRQIRINTKDVLLLTFITFLLYKSWGGILNQTIEGEGFYYFSPSVQNINLWGYDNLPVLATTVLERLFGGNISYYMALEFITLPVMAIVIYFFIKRVTGKNLIAFFSTILICVNFFGLFQLVGRGHYAWYLQRLPQIFLIIPSLWFLYKFLHKGGLKNYLYSLALFSLGILSNHYTSLYTSFFLALFASNLLLTKKFKKPIKNVLSTAALCVPFLISNAIIISKTPLAVSNYRPGEGFFHFLINPQNWFDKFLYQLTVITFPTNIFARFYHKPIDYEVLIRGLILPVLIFYAVLFFYLYKRKVKFFEFLFATFLALLSVVFLNIFLNQFDIYSEILQGRYYFIPSLYTGIILGSFLGILYEHKNRLLKIIILGFLGVWIMVNIQAISQKVSSSQPMYEKIKSGLAFLADKTRQFPQGSIIVLPSPIMPIGGDFYAKFYTPNDAIFYYLDSQWQLKIPADYPLEKIFVYEYDKTQKNLLIDKSQQYRELIKQNSQKKR